MNNTICYLNTDLDLVSRENLTELAEAFEGGGAICLHVTQREDGSWHASFETDDQRASPEESIAQMLAVIESFGSLHKERWRGCSLREFNIGYDCGAEPWAFNQGLSTELLGRIAAAGASLRITLYPDRTADEPAS